MILARPVERKVGLWSDLALPADGIGPGKSGCDKIPRGLPNSERMMGNPKFDPKRLIGRQSFLRKKHSQIVTMNYGAELELIEL